MTKRRAAMIGILACLLVALSGCVAIQPKADGTLGVSLVAPGSKPPTPTVGTGGSGSSSSSSSSGGKSKTIADSKTAAASKAGPRPVGEEQTSGTWKVNVESTEQPKRLPDGSTPHSRKQFLVVNVTVQNMAQAGAIVIHANQFKLMDTHGVAIKPFPTSLPAYNAQVVRPIEVTMGGSSSFVYEIPDGSSGYGFVVSPGQGAGSVSWIVP